MGRPQLTKESKRSKRIIFRVTENELQQLMQLSETCGKPPSELIREKLFNGRFPQAKTAKLDLLTYTELKKIGVNINQLAWKVNSGFLPFNLLAILRKLSEHQELIIFKLTHDRHSENR